MQETKDDRIKKIKELVKDEDIYLEKCEKYGKPPLFADDIKISFSPDIDVSAKTVNGEVFLNEKLFSEDIEKQVRYAIHEIIHCMQQDAGCVSGKVDKDDYLDDPNEQEAFSAQIYYMCGHESLEEIQNYIENLLDHHEIEGEERKEKAQDLVKDLGD